MAGTGESKEWSAAAVALGTRVTQERERLKLTKEALGERAGLASRYVWRVEEGLQNLQLGNLLKISEALGLTLSELLAGVEDLVINPVPKAARSPRGPKAAAIKR
jgi:transcriptional regulator with XRE-family HTH domain